MNIKNFFFTYRSYTPIPLALAILYFSNFKNALVFPGIFLLVLGEAIRVWAVSYAGGATRTTKVGAPYLCVSGPYSRVRNPLYIGNMLIYTAFVLIAGSNSLWTMLSATWVFFVVQYSLIISLEERALISLFGENYNIYCKNVPPLLPRIYPWNRDNSSEPAPLIQTLKTEKRTLQNIIFVLFLIVLKNKFIL